MYVEGRPKHFKMSTITDTDTCFNNLRILGDKLKRASQHAKNTNDTSTGHTITPLKVCIHMEMTVPGGCSLVTPEGTPVIFSQDGDMLTYTANSLEDLWKKVCDFARDNAQMHVKQYQNGYCYESIFGLDIYNNLLKVKNAQIVTHYITAIPPLLEEINEKAAVELRKIETLNMYDTSYILHPKTSDKPGDSLFRLVCGESYHSQIVDYTGNAKCLEGATTGLLAEQFMQLLEQGAVSLKGVRKSTGRELYYVTTYKVQLTSNREIEVFDFKKMCQ